MDPDSQMERIQTNTKLLSEKSTPLEKPNAWSYHCNFPAAPHDDGSLQVPLLRYSTSPASLRPVPLQVQTALQRTPDGSLMKLTLQLVANPRLAKPLLQVRVVARVPGVGQLQEGRPPVHKMDNATGALEWHLPGLHPGQKRLLAAVCTAAAAPPPHAQGFGGAPGGGANAGVRVTVYCHSQDALLSSLTFGFTDMGRENGSGSLAAEMLGHVQTKCQLRIICDKTTSLGCFYLV
uniref:MHD domain-containing protein n=1 Tax=Heterosigma akashiwo TaxID=2829 RepID=A0A7S3XMU8_HETAK